MRVGKEGTRTRELRTSDKNFNLACHWPGDAKKELLPECSKKTDAIKFSNTRIG